MSFDALVLAGSRGGADPVADHAGVSDKALIRIDGETMLSHVLAALRAAGAGRILVAVSSPAVAACAEALGVETLAAEAGPSLSTRRGLERLGAPLLVTTADHALLDPAWVRDFLADVPPDADVSALLARRELVERDAAGTRRTYLKFADGDWSGCNLFHLATPRAIDVIDLWRGIEADRKRPWRIVRRLGPTMLLRYLIGRLTIASALSALGTLSGTRIAAIAARCGRAAVDVDTPADLDWVRAYRSRASDGRDDMPEKTTS